MLLLRADQVSFCDVMVATPAGPVQRPGVAYQNKLFLQRHHFELSEREAAIRQVRQAFLDGKGLVMWLCLESSDSLTLWQEDPHLTLASPEVSPTQVDLKSLVAAMRNVGGITIKDRRYQLKTYPRCFVGSEATAWLMRHLDITAPEAIQIGQRLIDDKWIHHVLDEQPFQDDYYFYRFYYDE